MTKFLIPSIDKPTEEGLSDYLTRSIEAFSALTGIPVTYFDKEHRICAEFGPATKLCSIFRNYRDPSGPCRLNLSSSGEYAAGLGEPYLFQCPSGFLHIAMALISDRQFLGYLIAGPIMIQKRKEKIIEKLSEQDDLGGATLSLAKLLLDDMERFDAQRVSMAALMLYNTVITALSGENEYDLIRDQSVRQEWADDGSEYTGHSQIIVSALRYIRNNYKRKITLAMVEEALHVNGSYFSTLFKNEMGISFTRYLNRLRVEEACRMLKETDRDIVGVMLAVGFEDQSYFTKVFKKETGMTPRQNRNANT